MIENSLFGALAGGIPDAVPKVLEEREALSRRNLLLEADTVFSHVCSTAHPGTHDWVNVRLHLPDGKRIMPLGLRLLTCGDPVLDQLTQANWPTVMGPHSDGIVSLSRQTANQAPYYTHPGIVHSGGIELLNAKVTGPPAAYPFYLFP